MIITFSGYYGSGGHDLAYALASSFGMSIYGQELIAEAVKDAGIDLKGSTWEYYDEAGGLFDKKDQQQYSRALLSLEMDVLPIASSRAAETVTAAHTGILGSFMDTLPISYREDRGVTKIDDVQKLVASQTRIVKDLATDNCIFLGRCASYILRNREDLVSIFTHAPLAVCRERISRAFDMSDENIDALIKRTNHRRALYYNTFTGESWDDITHYDYCLDVNALGYDKTLELLKKLVELKLQ